MFLVHIFLCIKLGFFFFLHAMVFFCASKRRKKNQISYQAAFYVSMFYDGKSWKRQNLFYFLEAVHKRRLNFLAFFDTPSPRWNFDPDLLNFYLLIFCNIGIWEPPTPLKYSDVFYGRPPIFFLEIDSSKCFFSSFNFLERME